MTTYGLILLSLAEYVLHSIIIHKYPAKIILNILVMAVGCFDVKSYHAQIANFDGTDAGFVRNLHSWNLKDDTVPLNS